MDVLKKIKQMLEQKKAQAGGLWGLVGLVMALGITAIVIGVVVYVLATIKAAGSIASDVNATAALNTGVNAVQGVSTWLGLLSTVAISAVVISLVIGAFMVMRQRQ